MKVVDASVWVSFSLLRDVNHRETRLWVDSYVAAGSRFSVPSIFLVEVASALRRRAGSPIRARTAVAKIESELLFDIHEMDRQLINDATVVAIDRGIRAADALYVALALRLSVPLVTWDNEQLRRAAGIVQVLPPAEASQKGF